MKRFMCYTNNKVVSALLRKEKVLSLITITVFMQLNSFNSSTDVSVVRRLNEF